jgi:hypothetical protein
MEFRKVGHYRRFCDLPPTPTLGFFPGLLGHTPGRRFAANQEWRFLAGGFAPLAGLSRVD